MDDLAKKITKTVQKTEYKTRTQPGHRLIPMLIMVVFFLSLPSVYAMASATTYDISALNFEKLDREDGLVNLSVSSIVQDKYGFMWFGTQGGLNRYDGTSMLTFKTEPFSESGLSHNLIQTMIYDEDHHRLWIGTYSGLTKLDIGSMTFTQYQPEKYGLSNPVVVAIALDVDNQVWLGTLDGLNLLNTETGDTKVIDIPGGTVRSLYKMEDGRLLVATYQGLFIYDPIQDMLDKVPLTLPSDLILSINRYEDHQYTIGIWGGGILTIDKDLDPATMVIKSYENNSIYTTMKTKDGTLWVGTWGGGLYVENQVDEITYLAGNKHGLPHNVIYSFYEDDQDNLWIGTNGGGVVRVDPNKRNYLYLSAEDEMTGLPKGKVNAILKDQMDNLWVAIYNDGLYRFTEGQEPRHFYLDGIGPDYLGSNQILDIVEKEDGKIYLGSDNGVYELSNGAVAFEKLPLFEKDLRIYALELDESYLWLGTYTEGVYRYDPLKGEVLSYAEVGGKTTCEICDDMVYDLMIDQKGQLWIASNHGLTRGTTSGEILNSYYEVVGDYTSLPSDSIEKVIESTNGEIWVGTTDGGVAKYLPEADAFISYTEKEGLASNNVATIESDLQGDIWVATTDGLSVLEYGSQNIINLTPEDGIGSWEFYRGSFKDKTGAMFFGGAVGITYVNGHAHDANEAPIRVYLQDLEADHQVLAGPSAFFNDEYVSLPANNRSLQIGFVAIDYNGSESLVYRYKLDHLDEDYVETKNNQVAYSNLKPGDYTFWLQARNLRSEWSDPVKVMIQIKTPWYRTIYAYGLYLILTMVLIYMIFEVREAKILDAKNAQLNLINSKLEKANQSLEALSTLDSLTGLYNRRYFDMKFDEHLHLAQRSLTNISLLMIDVDLFKEINDRQGHLVGDQYLTALGEILKSVLHRSTDIAVRYGGDEFVILLYDNDIDGTLTIANRITQEVDALRIVNPYSSVKVKATVSIGAICFVPSASCTKEEAISHADEALYQAKSLGRNRVCLGDTSCMKPNYDESNLL